MVPEFGIKIGNSTVCVAFAKNDKVEVIANKHGDRVSPAVLLYTENEIEVGLTAKQKMFSKMNSSISNILQHFLDMNSIQFSKYPTNNRKAYSINFNEEQKSFEIVNNNDNKTINSVTLFETFIEIFNATIELVHQYHLSEDKPSAVLGIPNYYSKDCWNEIRNAANQAGFNVLQIIPESTAAVLTYEMDINRKENLLQQDITMNNSKHVLIIKCGGLLSNFTLIEVTNGGLYSIINSVGPFYIGGKQFTDVLVEYIANEFNKKYKLDPRENRRSMAKINNAAENCKHILTTLPSNQIYIDSLMDGVDFNLQMSRARFDSLIQPALNEFMAILTESFEKMIENDMIIDKIILIGGTMKIPRIQSAIFGKFPDSKLLTNFSPDEVVAMGCAWQTQYVITDETTEEEQEIIERYETIHKLTKDIFICHENNGKTGIKQLIANIGTIIPIEKIIVNVKKSTITNGATGDNESFVNMNGNVNDNTCDETSLSARNGKTELLLEENTEELKPNKTVDTFHILCDDKEEIVNVTSAECINDYYKLYAKIEENNGFPVVTLTPSG